MEANLNETSSYTNETEIATGEKNLEETGVKSDGGGGDDQGGGGGASKVSEVAKTAIAKAKDFAVDGKNAIGRIPAWVLIPIFSTFLLLFCLFLVLHFRRKWRKFRRSDEGRLKIQKWSQHPTFGKYLEKIVPPLEPPQDITELTTFEEPPATEEDEEAEAPNQDLGSLHYKLAYNFDNQNFSVTILECKDLPAKESTGTSDPYVKVFFMGEKKSFETKVHRSNLNPVYNETFVFKGIPFDDLMGKILNFEVYDYVRFRADEQTGEFRVVLCQIELMTPYEAWSDWDLPEDDEEPPPGDICISLRWNPGKPLLTLAIVECKNLKEMDLGGGADPFAKVNFFLNGKKHSKKKTEVKKGTLNPYFNSAFNYDLTEKDLRKCHFVITVYDYDLIGSCTPIGKISIGPEPNQMVASGIKHWEEMLKNPRRPIIQWHTLIEPEEFDQKGNENETGNETAG